MPPKRHQPLWDITHSKQTESHSIEDQNDTDAPIGTKLHAETSLDESTAPHKPFGACFACRIFKVRCVRTSRKVNPDSTDEISCTHCRKLGIRCGDSEELVPLAGSEGSGRLGLGDESRSNELLTDISRLQARNKATFLKPEPYSPFNQSPSTSLDHLTDDNRVYTTHSNHQSESRRFVQLVSLNADVPTITPNLLVYTSSKYSEIEQQLNESLNQSAGSLKILEQHFGPRPYWKYPDNNSTISRTTRTLYLVDSKKSVVVAVLRTENEDYPLVIDLGALQQKSSNVLDVLQKAVNDSGLRLESASIYATNENLKDQRYDDLSFGEISAFPTIFFIICIHSESAFQFKTNLPSSIGLPVPFQMAISRCETLVERALSISIMPLQCLHVSRALLHLSITLANSDQQHLEELINLFNLQRIIDKFDDLTSDITSLPMVNVDLQRIKDRLDRVFLSCCNDYPGAVAVRQSYDVYMTMSQSDLREWQEQGHQKLWNAFENCESFSDSSTDSEIFSEYEMDPNEHVAKSEEQKSKAASIVSDFMDFSGNSDHTGPSMMETTPDGPSQFVRSNEPRIESALVALDPGPQSNIVSNMPSRSSEVTPDDPQHVSLSHRLDSSPQTNPVTKQYREIYRLPGHTSQSLPGKNARIYFSTRHEMHYGFNNASDHAINYRGVVYRTAEHLYQALKFLDHEPIIAELVRRAIEPRRAAQKYDHQKRPDWAKVRLHELERVLFLKFDTYPGLKKDLLATGEAQLIQEDDNEFGGVLMKVRDTLRANKSPDLLGTRI